VTDDRRRKPTPRKKPAARKPAPRASRSDAPRSDAPRRPAAPRREDDLPLARGVRGPRTPAATPVEATPVEADEAKALVQQLPAWRQRLYKIPVLGVIAFVIWPPRRSASNVRRAFSAALAIVAILGIGMAAYPWAGTKYPAFYRIPVERLIDWSNFLSDLRTNKLQDQLAKEFAGMKGLALREGQPLTRIEIPKLGVDTIVVQGTSPSALRAGAGHYPNTPLPGQKGNVAIAGHRTTYGRPFNKVDQLRPGDKIILTTPVGRYTYSVTRLPWITDPWDWSVVDKSTEPLLTLTACHPKGSARQRLIVRAKLIRSEPVTHQSA
jgi:LPXTG-site transpeptidase (sortase) family protein